MGFYSNIEGRIIDIRQDKSDPSIATSIRDDLIASLSRDGKGEKCMPEMLLWDQKGHELFEKVNARPEYYVHHDELTLLEKHKEAIVRQLEPGAMIIELGSGYVIVINPTGSSQVSNESMKEAVNTDIVSFSSG